MNKQGKRTFRVLVVDDSMDVLKHAKNIVGSTGRLGCANETDIQVTCVPMEVCASSTKGGKAVLTMECLRSLASAVESPPDLILLDYGYADAVIGNKMVSVSTSNVCSEDDKKEIENGMITAEDVRKDVEDGSRLNTRENSLLLNNFFGCGAPVYVYTFCGPPALREAIGSVENRHEKIDSAFPNSKVVTIDTHKELYYGPTFEDRRDGSHHRYLTARLLDWIVVKEVARFEAESRERERCESRLAELNRKNRRKKLSKLVVSGIGVAAGYALSLIADTVLHKDSSRNLPYASALFVGIVFLVALDYLLNDGND